jgi:hypothetical protein
MYIIFWETLQWEREERQLRNISVGQMGCLAAPQLGTSHFYCNSSLLHNAFSLSRNIINSILFAQMFRKGDLIQRITEPYSA